MTREEKNRLADPVSEKRERRLCGNPGTGEPCGKTPASAESDECALADGSV